MPEPESRIRIAISDNFLIDGIAVTIGFKLDNENIDVIHFDNGGHPSQRVINFTEQILPSFILQHDFARALLDALLRYYQGSSDLHQLRQDFLHERSRVDKMLDTIIQVATLRGKLLGYSDDGSPVYYIPETKPPLGRQG